MPKVYISTEAKQRAATEKKYKVQKILLIAALKEAVKNKYTYDEISKRSGVSVSTVCKAFNRPEEMRIDLFKKICDGLGLYLNISIESNEP